MSDKPLPPTYGESVDFALGRSVRVPADPPVVPDTAACDCEFMDAWQHRDDCPNRDAAYPSEKARQLVEARVNAAYRFIREESISALLDATKAERALLSYMGATEKERDEAIADAAHMSKTIDACDERIEAMQKERDEGFSRRTRND